MILKEKDLIVCVVNKHDKDYILMALHPDIGIVKYRYIGFNLSDAKVKFKLHYENIGEYRL